MVAREGREPEPLLATAEETTSPMTVVGKGEIAFAIGPEPRQTIAVAEIASGRVVRRIAPGKNAIDSLTSSPDGQMLYFAAGGAIWSVPSHGGETRKITAGESAIMEPSGTSLVVERNELARIRLFHTHLDGGPEQEISIDRSLPLFPRPLSPSAMDGDGRLLVGLLPRDSWFVPVAVLDTATGRIRRVPADDLEPIISPLPGRPTATSSRCSWACARRYGNLRRGGAEATKARVGPYDVVALPEIPLSALSGRLTYLAGVNHPLAANRGRLVPHSEKARSRVPHLLRITPGGVRPDDEK